MRIKQRDEDGEDTDERKLRFRVTTVFDTLSRYLRVCLWPAG